MREISFLTAINEAYHEEFKRDPTVFIMGENIAKKGGFMGEMKGLAGEYGLKRVKDTPISETAIIGEAIGAAACGLRPILAMGNVDFIGVAMDEIWNQLTKMRYMFGGKAKLPVTLVCYSGGGLSAAAQHSQSAEGLYMCIPGLKLMTPCTPYDAKGLLKSAIRDDNPKIFFIHKYILLSGMKGEVPEEEYTIPLGKADVKRKGNDVTVVAIGLMVHRALAAADRLQKEKGLSLEVVDPRSIVPLDKQAIFDSVKKTGRLVIIDEEPKTGSASAEIAALVADEAFDYLDAPIKRVCAPDTPVPFSPVLEKFWMPDEDDLIKAINQII
jgi:pyruvate dehydrogenase E1 component beta subunit